jgi:O-antigen biosynthesis protein
VVVLSPGCRLWPHAAAALAHAAAEAPEVSLLFGDEDRLDRRGEPDRPWIKPDFDPVLLRHWDYLGMASFWRAAYLRQSPAGRRPFAEWRQDPGALVRDMDETKVRHLARVLVSAPAAIPLGTPRRPSKAHPARSGAGGHAPLPDVSFIIPTRDRLDLLTPCIESIARFTPTLHEIVIVDNGSTEPATLAYLARLAQSPDVKVLRIDAPFNYSDLSNRGAAVARADVLVFLNNDTTFIDTHWLEAIAPHVRDPQTGPVGAKLLYPSGLLQHAGVVMGIDALCAHYEMSARADTPGVFRRLAYPHRVSAVTAAFLAIERDKFFAVGGFDAEHLPVDLNDIDLCLRLGARGLHSVYVPGCRLIHYESASRGYRNDPDIAYRRERGYFTTTWAHAIRSDPHFSPCLSLHSSVPYLG